MPALRAPLFVSPSIPTTSVTISVGFQRPILAFINVTMVDSLIDYDFDNAVAADIFTVNGALTTPLVSGGSKWGPPGSIRNVFQGAFVGSGTTITYFLRVRGPDIAALAEAVVITEP
jgi:hypothetical protein